MSSTETIGSGLSKAPRAGPAWRSPGVWLAVLIGCAIGATGLRCFLDPVGGSAAFGLPMHTAAETAFVQVYGARNLFCGVLALALVALRQWRALGVMVALALVLPPFDMAVLASHVGPSPIFISHLVIMAALALSAVLLWRRADALRG